MNARFPEAYIEQYISLGGLCFKDKEKAYIAGTQNDPDFAFLEI